MMDIFYKFPLNYGMPSHSANLAKEEILSNRVVLISFDGFRADTFYETINMGKNPFLENIIKNRGVYGVSHLKVPTESKPCFTAMSTGHFQDGSLALKHIFGEYVNSDSIYKQSNYAWGTGFIIDYFTKDTKNMDNVPLVSYPYNDEFYISYNYNLFHTIIDFLNNAKNNTNSTTYKRLLLDKITFLMHVTETDGLGHKYGPKSNEIKNNLMNLDKNFSSLENAFYNFYHDNKTTFILTSDHGMNMKKFHGDDDVGCKRVPFLAWGAGIRKSIHREQKPQGEDTPEDWGLNNFVRRDIEEIDIASLVAGLIDINIPINNYGTMPVDILDTSDKIKSKLLFTNFEEIFEIYKMKNETQSKSTFFMPYKPMDNSQNQINEIIKDMNNDKYIEAIDKTKILIKKTLDGIDYLLKYDRLFLEIVVVTGYILWMIYLLIFIEMKNTDNLNKFFLFNYEDKNSNTNFGRIVLIICMYLYLRNSPFIYYLYSLFPCYFGWRIFSNINYLKSFFTLNNEIKFIQKNLLMYLGTMSLFFSLVSIII
jgi:phosphatidylinositol glycan class N